MLAHFRCCSFLGPVEIVSFFLLRETKYQVSKVLCFFAEAWNWLFLPNAPCLL